ncbi:MAG: hypothetical protein K2Y27_22010 [Xanthobacteraceae bacterium]|nr:hypothetical protein [Xanthobacteraceae bacterium]
MRLDAHAGSSAEAHQQLRLALRLLMRAEPAARTALLDLACTTPGLDEIVRQLFDERDREKLLAVAPSPELLEKGYVKLGHLDS